MRFINTQVIANVIIVDYYKSSRVVQNIHELQQQTISTSIAISVEDNSCDINNAKTLEIINKYPNVHLSVNSINKGYTQACNDAASRFNTGYIILVNPDISWIKDTTLHELVDLMDNNPDIGIAGPKQINDDGTTPGTVRSFPNIFVQIARRTPLRNLPALRKAVHKYEVASFDYSKSQYVDWIQSSLMIIRRDLWDKIGGLDDSYFLFMSDPDICYKAWANGYKVLYTADSLVRADGKRCSEGGLYKIFSSKALRHHVKDALKYQLKYMFKSNPRIIQNQVD